MVLLAEKNNTLIRCHEIIEYQGRLSFIFEDPSDSAVPLSHIIESMDHLDDDFCKFTLLLIIQALRSPGNNFPNLTGIGIHDLKAENIYCKPDTFQIKIVGAAAVVSKRQMKDMEFRHDWLPAWVALDQSGVEIVEDPVWTLGCLAYYLAMKQCPFAR